jgi:hypothetical protein
MITITGFRVIFFTGHKNFIRYSIGERGATNPPIHPELSFVNVYSLCKMVLAQS